MHWWWSFLAVWLIMLGCIGYEMRGIIRDASKDGDADN